MLEYHLATAHWVANHPIIHSGPLHTYPGIYESATIYFRIQKFPRPHVFILKSNFPSTRIRIHSSTQGSSRNIRNRACVVKTGNSRVKSKRENLGRSLPSWIQFMVKNWAGSCYVIGKKHVYIRIYHPHDFGFIALLFKISTLESVIAELHVRAKRARVGGAP